MTSKSQGLYLEDIAAGLVLRSARAIALERDDMIAFARRYDPQPAHIGEETAQSSQFGMFCASGWQTGCTTMRLIAETMPIAGGGMGSGMDELRWHRPVLPGDTLSIEIEILEARPSRSRPDNGVVTYRCATLNQRGEAVQTLRATVLFPRRARTVQA